MIANTLKKLSLSSSSAALALGVAALALSGCSFQSSAVPSPIALSAMHGTIMGGETPIAGSSVILWETDPANGGYGSTGAVQLATATGSTPGGNFTLTPAACASGQFLYLTSTGGDVSDGSATPIINDNVVLMAALGSCASFNTSTNIIVNELSTVAAAYTLGSFINVDDTTPGSQLVYIGAPANNNAATGSCTGNGSAMTCASAGLAHAFANAANLVNDAGSFPSGAAYATVPGNSLGSVPQAEIDALGDILEYCTNSGGGAAGDSSPCGNLFTDATPPSHSAPIETLQAAIDIAHNPDNNVGGTCTGTSGGLFCLVPATPAFTPVLATAPHDWSFAIIYTGLVVGGASSSWGSTAAPTYYPAWLALDANDNVYVLAGDANSSSGSSGTSPSADPSTVSAMSANGTGLWANAPTVDGTNGCYPGTIATDTNGNVWNTYAPPSSKSCTAAIYGRSATSGGAPTYSFTSVAPYSVQGQAFGLAFDRYNNLWYARDTSAGTDMMFQFPYSGAGGAYLNSSGSAASVTLTGADANPAGVMANTFDILIDANANLYVSTYSSTLAGEVYVVPNLTPGSTPSYTGGNSYLTQALAGATTPEKSGAIGISSSGLIWAGATGGEWTTISTSSTSGVISGLSGTAATVANSSSTTPGEPYPGQIDGFGSFWFPSFTSSGQIWDVQTKTSTTAPTTYEIYPCYAPNGATTCSANGTSTNSSRMLQIDSSGAIWIAAEGSGDVVQLLGAAAPLWPQLSYGVFATEPQ